MTNLKLVLIPGPWFLENEPKTAKEFAMLIVSGNYWQYDSLRKDIFRELDNSYDEWLRSW